MVITKTKLALEKNYFLKLIFSFSVLALIVYFSPHLHLVYSFIEIPESQILCLISSVAVDGRVPLWYQHVMPWICGSVIVTEEELNPIHALFHHIPNNLLHI